MKSQVWMIALILAITITGCFANNDDSQIDEATVDTPQTTQSNPVKQEKTLTQDSPVTINQKAKPAAVPAATAEEAEKLNSFAIFLTEVKKTVVEGEIIERSELPDPKTSDYPNCRFTAHFNGNSIKSGEPCPKEMAFIIEGFENFSMLDT